MFIEVSVLSVYKNIRGFTGEPIAQNGNEGSVSEHTYVSNNEIDQEKEKLTSSFLKAND